MLNYDKVTFEVIDQLNLGIMLVDEEYNVKFANQFIRLKMSHPDANVNAKTIADFYPAEKQYLQRKIRTVFILNSAAYSGWQQKPYIFKMDTPHPVTSLDSDMLQDIEFLPVISKEGVTELCVIVVRDATADAFYSTQLREATQTAISTSVDEGKNQRDELKRFFAIEQQRAILQFSAGFAHEINNPLGYTFSNVQLIQSYIQDISTILHDSSEIPKSVVDKMSTYLSELPELMTDINEGLDRIKSTVSNLESSASVSSHYRENVDIGLIFEEVFKMVAVNYSHGVTLIKPKDTVAIYANKDDLKQILYQLVDNSFAATKQSSKGLVKIDLIDDGYTKTFAITDNGCGIPVKDQPKVFEPFYSGKTLGEGKGLGLTIVKNILSQYGFSISMSSIPGKGTKFLIKFS
jgi:signal transduction histidine kinase